MTTITIACDGSSIQQGDFRKGDTTDRPGAAGFVAVIDGERFASAEPHANGTIGAMEVRALLMGLRFAAEIRTRRPDLRDEPIAFVCDSQYVVQGFNDWLPGWAAKNYHRKGGLANAADWRAIDDLKAALGASVSVAWTKGHSTHPLNNAVDELVNRAARTQAAFDDTARAFPDAMAALVRNVAERTGVPVLDVPFSAMDARELRGAPMDDDRADGPAVAAGVAAQAAIVHAAMMRDPGMAAFLADSIRVAIAADDDGRLRPGHSVETLSAADGLRHALEASARDRRGR